MQVKESYVLGNYPDGLGDNGKMNPLVADNWNFFVGTAAANRELASALGFKYRVADNGQFAHSSVFMVLTPDGRISRYLSPFLGDDKALAEQMKLALLEASDGKIAKGVSELMMSWCFMYDPKAGAYTLQAMRVMKIGAIISIVAVGSLITGLMIVDRARRRRPRAGEQVIANKQVVGSGAEGVRPAGSDPAAGAGSFRISVSTRTPSSPTGSTWRSSGSASAGSSS